ncbi:MAG: DEAD/DEAH box helicase [Sandaracinaceae bacterium]
MGAATHPLASRIPEAATADGLLEAFLGYADDLGLTLYEAQEEAILELFAGRSVILNTPTGSGKSLVATALCFKALAERKRAYYTAPIKALVSEKFFSMARTFGPQNVGMMTGDASVNREAPIVCCTAEILANIALREQRTAPVDYVVMDEFHYYGDPDRGWAWQVPLLTLPQARFLLMSATLGNTDRFLEALEALTGEEGALVRSDQRPVPLDFTYKETPLHETIDELLQAEKSPIYIVHFTQRSAAEQAQALMSVDFLTKDQKHAIKQELGGFRFDTPFGKDLGRFVRHGVGVHHAGLLPRYRLLVERLAQKGHLRIICGTDTLGVGVNIPIRTVLFTQLCKYDGRRTAVLTVRDFKQIAGRAGRRGYDEQGSVVAQAPEHVIENLQVQRKLEGDPKRLRKARFKKPPDRGYAHWDEDTFRRLIEGEPERLESSFQVNHGLLLQVLDRKDGQGCRALKDLIRRSHDPPRLKYAHGRTAIALFRSLLEAKVLEIIRQDGTTYVDVNADLQEDFSLNHELSLYVLDAVDKLDRDDEAYPFDVLTLVEATLEDPNVVLARQLDKRKGDRLAELKAEGVEYEERMAELDTIDIDKPRHELLLQTFEEFRAKHPWVGSELLRPKSIAREMVERAMSFRDYIKEYGLARSEGVLLRYLTDAYKSLVQTVPEEAKTDEVVDVTDELGAIVKTIDASLLEEWEKLKDPAKVVEAAEETERAPSDVTTDRRAFTAMVRNAMAHLVRALALGRFEDAADEVQAPEGEPRWTMTRLEEAIAPYYDEHEALRFDPGARSPKHTLVEVGDDAWAVRQVLVDPEEANDWSIEVRIDLERAAEAGRPVVELIRIGPS